jgi:hypothetical protein
MAHPMNPQTESNLSVDTATYLAHAVAVAREHGYVPAGATDTPPTWRAALQRFEMGTELAEPDLHRAHQILGWAASLKPRHPNGYRARMAACLAHDQLAAGDLPLAASAVRAFNLHLYYEIRGRKASKRPQSAPRSGTPT